MRERALQPVAAFVGSLAGAAVWRFRLPRRVGKAPNPYKYVPRHRDRARAAAGRRVVGSLVPPFSGSDFLVVWARRPPLTRRRVIVSWQVAEFVASPAAREVAPLVVTCREHVEEVVT